MVLVGYAAVVATPVEVLGCRTRGLIAVTIATAAGIGAVAMAVRAVVEQARGLPRSFRPAVAGAVLALPALHLVLFG